MSQAVTFISSSVRIKYTDVKFVYGFLCTVIVSEPITRSICIITGPPTHSVGGQTSNGLRRQALSSSVVVCNTVTRRICNVTHHGAARGGLVVLRAVKATSCFIYSVSNDEGAL